MNNSITMQDLLMNKKLKDTLPQFGDGELQNVYSYAEIERRVMEYLRGTLGATKVNGELRVKGEYSAVLGQTKEMAYTVEQFFNAIPQMAKNLRKNTKLYMPYASVQQIADIKGADGKRRVLEQVVQNIQFNPDLQSLNSVVNMGANFYRMQADWMRRTGYKPKEDKGGKYEKG